MSLIRFAIAFSLVAAAMPAQAADLTPRQRGDLAIQARAIMKTYCSECHGKKAGLFDALEYAQLTDPKRPVPFVNLDKMDRSQMIEFIEDGSMPPGGRRRPSDGEIKSLKDWIAAKAPRFFKEYDEATVLNATIDDWAKQISPGNTRYVSFAHRVDGAPGLDSLESEQNRLQQALDSATTTERACALQAVDDAATVFRIDIEKLGWTTKDLFYEIGLNQSPSPHDLIPFDLLLLENPYPLETPGWFEKYLGKSKHVRPVPFLRGDWLADVLAPDAPLAADLKSLVDLSGPGERPCGPRVRAFEKPKSNLASQAAVPLTSWYGPDRYEPFKVDVTIKGAKPPFAVRVGDDLPFEVVSEIGAKFILLHVLSDGSVRIHEPGGGSVLKAGESRSLQTNSRIPFKIPSILDGAETATEYFILIAAPDGVPLPTLVRTEHNTIGCPKKGTGQIWRMLFDPKFDQSKAVRKIVQINATKK